MMILAAMLAALCAGCASPGPADLDRADRARGEIRELLQQFITAVRAKNAEAAAGALSDHLLPADRQRMARMIEDAVWLEVYTGYDFDIEGAVKRLGWKDLTRGRVRFTARATNARGVEFKDSYAVIRTAEGWRIDGLKLRTPAQFGALDPPAGEKDGITALLTTIVELLKAGEAEQVYYMVRRSPTPFMAPSERQEGRERQAFNSVMTLKDLTVSRWPDPQKEIQLSYQGSGLVVADFQLVCTCPQQGWIAPGAVGVRVFLMKARQGWAPYWIEVQM